MTPTDVLREEHEGILLMLRILGKVCQRLESGQTVSQEHLEQILDFIKTFADRCHHGKEEDLLFPAMEKAGIPRDGPIRVMLEEHTLGRNYVKGFTDGVAAYRGGGGNGATAIIKNARGYIDLLGEHIDKENNILYRMAEMHVSPKRQQELVKEFERVEAERIGPGKHEAFHKLLEQLKGIYGT